MTNKTSCAAKINSITYLLKPAPVSIIIMSASSLTRPSLRWIFLCSLRFTFSAVSKPATPEIYFTPAKPSSTTSSSSISSSSKSTILRLVTRPIKTLTFAIPISASISKTFLPAVCIAIAKLTAKLVLPTPPLPLVIAITLVFSSTSNSSSPIFFAPTSSSDISSSKFLNLDA